MTWSKGWTSLAKLVVLSLLVVALAAAPASAARKAKCQGHAVTIHAEDVVSHDFPNVQGLASTYDAELRSLGLPADEVTELVQVYVQALNRAESAFARGRADGIDVPVIVGTMGNDVIVGTNSGDWIIGLGGHDVICGLMGSDYLSGGSGDDRIRGGSGDDHLSGGLGNNYLVGGKGSDTLNGRSELELIMAAAQNRGLPPFGANIWWA